MPSRILWEILTSWDKSCQSQGRLTRGSILNLISLIIIISWHLNSDYNTSSSQHCFNSQQERLVQEEFFRKLNYIRRVVEDLKEKTWELDTNTRNNLVFYGIKEESAPGNTEWAVREVRQQVYEGWAEGCIVNFRSSRTISTSRETWCSPSVSVTTTRTAEGSALSPSSLRSMLWVHERQAGSKIIFPLNFQDRNGVFQKANLLVGTGILISEDFPKNILKKRDRLTKFAKEVKIKITLLFNLQWKNN